MAPSPAPDGSPPARFAEMLRRHMQAGTRPGKRGLGAWSVQEFAHAIGVSERTVNYYRSGATLPPKILNILDALFADDARHVTAKAAFVGAFERARGLEPSEYHDSLAELRQTLEEMCSRSAFTERLTLMLAPRRDLIEPRERSLHNFAIGARIIIVLESDRPGSILLLDRGTSGRVSCLCPSHFAPNTTVPRGRSRFPQNCSRFSAFEVAGQPGREELLAIVTDTPLCLSFLKEAGQHPPTLLTHADIGSILGQLSSHDISSWALHSTHFDVQMGY
jgi:hypothetical protein